MILFKVALILMGLLACGLALWLQYMNRKAKDWPETEGVILESMLESDADTESSVKIVYEYSVKGRTFKSHQFSYTALANDLPAKKRRVAQYPAGRRVSVFYDPRNPSAAVIERGESAAWIGVGITGLIFVIAGLVIS